MPQIPHRPRVIAIGDIHGCAIALRVLIDAIEPQAGDTVIPLGDVVDYGPDSRDVIEQLMQLARIVQLILLRGNHEEMLLSVVDDHADPEQWLRFGGDATLASFDATADLSRVLAEHLEFLRAGRLIYETDTHFFVHANYYSNQRLTEQPRSTLLWEDLQASRAAPHYSGKIAVVGHTIQNEGILNLGFVQCLDTNACGGGWLTALDTTSGRYWQTNELGELRAARLKRRNEDSVSR